MSTQTGRNDPCPCGSGKKYKKCCFEQHQRERLQSSPIEAPSIEALKQGMRQGFSAMLEDDGLTELSNSVVDLIRDGRLEEAEAACTQLRERFPDDIDWLERAGALHEACGRHAEAAEHYRKALEYTLAPDQADYFEERSRQWFRDKITEMDRLAASLG